MDQKDKKKVKSLLLIKENNFIWRIIFALTLFQTFYDIIFISPEKIRCQEGGI